MYKRQEHTEAASSSSVPSTTETGAEVVAHPGGSARNHVTNILLICAVFLGGFLSWYISYVSDPNPIEKKPDLHMNWMAQFFGYLSAVLYLGSRVPQILLNFQRKSCEGISFLFFLFACIGNTTFIISVLSISVQPRYLLVNASWLIGSFGTLFMDFIIFMQFFAYEKSDSSRAVGVAV